MDEKDQKLLDEYLGSLSPADLTVLLSKVTQEIYRRKGVDVPQKGPTATVRIKMETRHIRKPAPRVQ